MPHWVQYCSFINCGLRCPPRRFRAWDLDFLRLGTAIVPRPLHFLWTKQHWCRGANRSRPATINPAMYGRPESCVKDGRTKRKRAPQRPQITRLGTSPVILSTPGDGAHFLRTCHGEKAGPSVVPNPACCHRLIVRFRLRCPNLAELTLPYDHASGLTGRAIVRESGGPATA